jgi:hypothetical protein
VFIPSRGRPAADLGRRGEQARAFAERHAILEPRDPEDLDELDHFDDLAPDDELIADDELTDDAPADDGDSPADELEDVHA